MDFPLAEYLPLHSFLEVVSIVVASLVFAVMWNTYARERPRSVVVLACASLAAALIDFAHLLSYPGMPDFVTPAGAEQNLVLANRIGERLVKSGEITGTAMRRELQFAIARRKKR